MTDMFRNMDNETIRYMMKTTRGMDVTDEQIMMMKYQANPDRVKSAINMQSNINTSSTNTSNTTNPTFNPSLVIY